MLSKDDFIEAMADRFITRGGMPDDKDTREYAMQVLDCDDVTFHDPAHEWDAEAARTLADTDMDYWEGS